MSRTKIFIDAGHNYSQFNTGAEGNGMREQDITFEVSFLLGEILKSNFDIRLSRPTLETNLGTDTNSSINVRWQMANEWGADYFISVHVNAGGGTGAETFIAATKPDDRAFALAVNDTYAAAMNLRNRGVKLDTESNAGSLSVLRHTDMPAIMIELAFIDSPPQNPDVQILRDRRADMAAALAKGINQYLG
ncbi:MAG: N-acetylmuramoyl-L-alanine amidase [Defluviitaleaceae bacterium]|nr:N-acetylmuramoyl-L-alanine amidase [Defluviitaleaceae bacterium]MCL2835110.1 N-acetylmuramoyl-L-alanine amidase [Defluviitaleaceae bacterium]